MSAEAFDPFEGEQSTDQPSPSPTQPEAKETSPGAGREPAAPAAVEKPVTSAELQAAVREFGEAVKGSRAEVKAPSEAMTPAQLAAHYKIYNPTAQNPKFFEEFLGLADDMDPVEKQARVGKFAQLFAGMQRGLVEQAVTIAQRNFERYQQQLEERLTPLQQAHAEQSASNIRDGFYKSYPILQDTKYEKLIAAVATSISGNDYADATAYYKALAEGVAGSIKAFVPEFDLSAATQNNQNRRTTPKLPRTSAGGTGGAGGAAQKTESTNQADSLF